MTPNKGRQKTSSNLAYNLSRIPFPVIKGNVEKADSNFNLKLKKGKRRDHQLPPKNVRLKLTRFKKMQSHKH